jgi:hypothetical protein
MKTIKFLIIALLVILSTNSYSQTPLKKKKFTPTKQVNKSYSCYKDYVKPAYSNKFYYNQYYAHNALPYPRPVTFHIRLRKHY